MSALANKINHVNKAILVANRKYHPQVTLNMNYLVGINIY